MPSSGCSVTDVTTGTAIDLTMNVPGQSTPREYRLSVPADYVPGEPLPVVFVLNGVGGTGPQAQQFFQVETGHRAIFVYPTSLPNDEAGGSIAWDFSLNGVDVPFFDGMVSYINDNYCVDTSRIFVLGASSGGIMSNMLGCFRGDVFRAIAPSSGMTWQQSGCQGEVAVMVICGEQDSFNPCDDASNGGLSQINVWVPLNGCTQPTQTTQSSFADICQEFAGCRAEDPLLLCRHAGGHGWPTSDGDFWWQFFMSLD
jgi:polyhydroxybutyrate depolymerase